MENDHDDFFVETIMNNIVNFYYTIIIMIINNNYYHYCAPEIIIIIIIMCLCGRLFPNLRYAGPSASEPISSGCGLQCVVIVTNNMAA